MPKFIYEIFYQRRLIKVMNYFKISESLGIFYGSILSTSVLANMKILNKYDAVMIDNPITKELKTEHT